VALPSVWASRAVSGWAFPGSLWVWVWVWVWVWAPASTIADGIGKARKLHHRQCLPSSKRGQRLGESDRSIVCAWPAAPNTLVFPIGRAGCREKSDGLPQAYRIRSCKQLSVLGQWSVSVAES
jgi:hypothetical protein